MYSSTSNETMSFPPPSAPPEPPPPPPPFTPHPFPPMYSTPPVPTTNISVNVANQKSDIATPKFPSIHSPRPWSTGLCGCCEDFSSCCLTCWCPCVAFGRIAEIVDRGSTSCGVSGALYLLIMSVTGCSCLCSCLYSCFYRSKLRGQYFLDESPCADCCVHCCCEQCALCQEYRELKNQGFDMSIGWHGNMERQKRGVAAEPPTVQNRMNRWE